MSNVEIIVCENAEAVCAEAAQRFASAADVAINEQGKFRVALSGGSTPRRLYQQLASATWREKINWQRVHLYWSDERAVAPDDAESNYRMAREALVNQVQIPPANIHRIAGEQASVNQAEADAAATDYESKMREEFDVKDNETPVFDLILLGMGADGHTASLFPNTSALNEDEKLITSVWVEEKKTRRVTMTYRLINHAANILFLVTGADKSRTLREVLEPETAQNKYPSQRVKALNGSLVWLVDEAAASELTQGNISQRNIRHRT